MNKKGNFKSLDSLLLNKTVKDSLKKSSFYESSQDILNEDIYYKHSTKKPKILSKNNLELLSFKNSFFLIGKFNSLVNLHYSNKIKNILFEFDTYSSLHPLNIKTRNNALMMAYHSGILKDYIGEQITLTSGGFLPQSNYNFFVKSHENQLKSVRVRNYQPYIDGIFESNNKIVLVLTDLYYANDLSLKELFLPYLYWKSKTTKDIVNIYLTFSNDIFTLHEINFLNPDILNIGNVKQSKSYKISNDKIVFQDLINIFNQVSIVQEKEIPFPQANEFERVIDLIHLLSESELSLYDISSNYSFDIRQAKYYSDAAIYLDLITFRDKNSTKNFILTEKARKIVQSRIKDKYLLLVKAILEHNVFNLTFKLFLENNKLKIDEIVELMKQEGVHNIKSESTYKRRASTVLAWIKWIINLPNIYY